MSRGAMPFAVIVMMSVCAASPGFAGAGVCMLQPGPSPWNVTAYLEYLTMPVANTADLFPPPPEQDLFRPVGERSIRLGLTDRTTSIWLRLALENPLDDADKFILEIDNPRLNTVVCYAPKPGGGYTTALAGTDHTFGEYTIQCARPSFHVTLPPHQRTTVYLRVENKGWMLANVYLWRPGAFENHVTAGTLIAGLFYGMMLGMVLFSAVNTLRLRDRSFFYHTFLVLACLGYEMSFHGAAHHYLWPNAIWWTDRSVFMFLGMAMFFAFVFARSFLNTRVYAPRLDKWMMLLAVLSLVIPLGKASDYLWVNAFAHIMGLLGPPTLIVAGTLCLRKGYRPAWAFLLGWGGMLVGAIMLNLWALDFLPDNIIFRNTFHLGMAMMPLLQSLALADRIRYMEHNYQRDLERQVEERTRELREALDNVKTLRGFIPICARCKKVRDDAGYWSNIEAYLRQHSDADFTHGICPECAHILYGRDLAGGMETDSHSAAGKRTQAL